MRNRVELSEKYTVPSAATAAVVVNLSRLPPAPAGSTPTRLPGLLHREQSPVGVADDERAVARVHLQAQRAAVGVGEQPGRAAVTEPGRPPPDPAVLDARVQPAGGVEYDVFRLGPAGHLPPLNLVEHLVAGERARPGRRSRRGPRRRVDPGVRLLAGPYHDAPPCSGRRSWPPPRLRLAHGAAQLAERAGRQLDHVTR